MKTFILTLLLFVSSNLSAKFMEYDLHLPEQELIQNFQVPADYQELVTRLHTLYDADISNQNAKLQIEYDLKSSAVNAFASRENQTWKITFKGGLLRNKRFDRDLFALILCHELGHHIAGEPLKFPAHPQRGWVSTEGQSDYFATNSCLKKLFHHEDNLKAIAKASIPKKISQACLKFQNKNDHNLCLRNGLISIKAGEFTRSLSRTRRGYKFPVPKINTPDKTVVTSTLITHPNPQCRLDTYFQGAICDQIKFPMSDPYENCPSSTQVDSGARPQCWFSEK